MEISENQEEFENAIFGCKRFQENLKKAADLSGHETDKEEDPPKDPGYILYDHIADTVVQILSNETVLKHICDLTNKFPDIPKEQKMDAMKSFMELFSVIIANTSYNAVICYDELLKKELTEQFDHMSEGINHTRAELDGQRMAIDVLKKMLQEVSSKLKINDLKSQIHV